jgi:hypothetical protein
MEPVPVKIVEPKWRLGKIIGAIAVALGAIAAVISIVQYVSGEEYLLGLFRVKSHVYEVGDTIHFGQWDWQVLDAQEDKALIITEDIIEMRPYNVDNTDVTWETCTLRAYLNGEFLEKFSAKEQARILEVKNTNPCNPWFEDIKGGNDTPDKVFLLSIEEVVEYFGNSGQLAAITKNSGGGYIDDQYNDERVAKYDGEAKLWWLRSPGPRDNYVALVVWDGCISSVNAPVSHSEIGVRPALWLKTD